MIRALLEGSGIIIGVVIMIIGLAMCALFDETAKLPPGAEVTGGGIYSTK